MLQQKVEIKQDIAGQFTEPSSQVISLCRTLLLTSVTRLVNISLIVMKLATAVLLAKK